MIVIFIFPAKLQQIMYSVYLKFYFLNLFFLVLVVSLNFLFNFFIVFFLKSHFIFMCNFYSSLPHVFTLLCISASLYKKGGLSFQCQLISYWSTDRMEQDVCALALCSTIDQVLSKIYGRNTNVTL